MYHASIKKVPATLLALLLTILLLAGAATAKQAEEEEESCDPEAVTLLPGSMCLPAGWELVEPDELPKAGSCGGPNEELGPPISHHTCLCDEEGPDGQAKCFSDPVEINMQANLGVKAKQSGGGTRTVISLLKLTTSNFVPGAYLEAGEVLITLSEVQGGVVSRIASRTATIVEAGQVEGGKEYQARVRFEFDNPLRGEYKVQAEITRSMKLEVNTSNPATGQTQPRPAIFESFSSSPAKRFRVP